MPTMDQSMNNSFGPITLLDVLTSSGREAIRQHSNLNGCAEGFVPRPLTVGETDYYVQHYVFPVQFILGVAGNCINLLVLLGSGMKNQANILLSAMAFADLAFLICLLPFSLVSFEIFYDSLVLSYLFYRFKTHFIAFANMFSMCASWIVLCISIERFTAVRRPMTRLQLRERRLYVLIALIFILAIVTTFWHHVEYDVTINMRCNTLKSVFKLTNSKPDLSPVFVFYLRYARLVQTIIGVAIPVLAVAFLNMSLIYFLRQREILPRIVSEKQRPEFRFVDASMFQRQERKVTATVLAIVSCFTITHLPTLGPFIWEFAHSYGSSGQNLPYSVITLLNTLLVSGKVLNFVLFCLSSAHFRHRTIVILSTRCQKSSNRKKYSSMATQSTVNNVKLSNAGSLHHSVLLHHNDSVDTPLNYHKSSPNSSSGTQRSQRVHLQLASPNISQNYLLREDSLEMPCCSSTATNSATNSARSNEDKKPGDSRKRIFGLFQKERTTTI